MSTIPKPILLLLAIMLFGVSTQKAAIAPSTGGPAYTPDAQLRLPQDYRDWVWLTSDFHSASDPAKTEAGARHWVNNIFVNPNAYKEFLQTGTWPDKTMLVVEQRATKEMGFLAPGRNGTDQSSLIGVAVHVKDETRFPGKWAFFGFQAGKNTSSMIPATASCYSCHAARGAVDTTFVQFYPTLLPTARSNNTLRPAYLQERGTLPSTTK